MEFCIHSNSNKFEHGNINELENYRFSNNRSFPTSYKDFAKKFGYGRSCGEFLIYIPMGDYCDSFLNQSQGIKGTYSDVLNNPDDVWFLLEPDANFEILKRLVPFAGSENGNYLFWDIESGNDEMDIYITDFRGLGFVKAANSLYEYFEKVTNEKRFKEVFPKFYQYPLAATFEPLKVVE